MSLALGEAEADAAEFSERLSSAAALTEAALEELLPPANLLGPRAPVAAAMRHASLNGGKRLRACLAVESAALFGADPAQAERVAAAIECLHAYSLVHDDLPCMDDDAMRRGQPTVHRKWDEATAVLAGDALQALGFEMVADPRCHDSAGVRADLALSLAQAAGGRGMVYGQALDMAAETTDRPLTLNEITELQAGKTGALITWSAQAGARLAEADLGPLTAYADLRAARDAT